MGDSGCTPFSGRGTECGRVSAQRSTRQTPSLKGHDRTLPCPKSPPDSLASGSPEAPLAPPPRCCCSKRNLLKLCPESGSLKLCPLVRGCDALRVAQYWCLEIPTSHSEDSWSSYKSLALPFLPNSPKLRGPDSQITSDSPKLSNARLKRLDGSAVCREATDFV